MAGQTFTLNLESDSALPGWQSVRDIAGSAVADKVTLIGGLMVDIHARRAGVVMPRPTVDVDVLVDYQAERSGLNSVARVLGSLGFSLGDQGQFGFRFRHSDGRKIDVMVADHLPSRMEPRLGRRPALPVPGGAQAIRRRDRYLLAFDSGAAVGVGVPDSTGALVVKSAAFVVDSRDRAAIPRFPAAVSPASVVTVTIQFDQSIDILEWAASSDTVTGVVLAAMGVGHVPQWCLDSLAALSSQKPVVYVSRTGAVPVFTESYGFPGSERDLVARGLIPAGSLSAHKARVLLAQCLASASSRDQAEDLFRELVSALSP